MRSALVALLFLVATVSLFAQQHVERQIQNLDRDFRAFKYKQVIEKGRFLLSDPYVTKEDSLQIYKYMLNAAYALADTAQAKKIIMEIIKCDPQFAFDPKDTSPKIIEFFNHVKKQIQAHHPIVPANTPPPSANQKVFAIKPLPFATTAFSLLLPGSGHLQQKFHKKGIWFTGFSSLLLGGITYTAIKTNENRKDYMNAKEGADFDRLYDSYNRMYKIRNLFIAAFAVWDIYVLFDLQKSWELRIKSDINNQAISLNITKHF